MTRTRIDTKKMIEKEMRKDMPAFDEKTGTFHCKHFWQDNDGKFSKRAFFFSVFAMIAIEYIFYAIITGDFNLELAGFILGCNAAFGLNYYKNEARKVGGIGAGRNACDAMKTKKRINV